MLKTVSSSIHRLIPVATAFLMAAGLPASPALGGFATPSNGDFSGGLADWTVTGDATVVQEEAVLGEQGTTRTVLYQGFPFPTGPVQVDFDVQNQLSAETTQDPFSFPDTAFVSLYFIDDLPSFDLAGGVFDAAQPLMDLDGVGTLELYGGTVAASVKGPDWMHYSGTFMNSNANVIVTYELFDLNALENDSFVFIDNIAVVVPEPATILLLFAGGGVAWRRHRRREMNPALV